MKYPPNRDPAFSSERSPLKENARPGVKYRMMLICVLIVGLLMRLGLAHFSPGAPHDMISYRMQGQAVLDGENIYAATAGRHPYPPVWMFVPAASLILESRTGWPFSFWVRLPSIGFDLGVGILIWILSERRKGPLIALQNTMLYLFNPIALLVISHGMFDAIPMFFILLAYWIVTGLSTRRRSVLSALSLGIGIVIKGFPALALPAFLVTQKKWQQRIGYGLVSLLPLVIVMPFILGSGQVAVERVFARLGVSDHGYGSLLQALVDMNHPSLQRGFDLLRARGSVLVLGCVLLGTWVARHRPLNELLLLAFGLTYVVSAGIASQYLLWILPFLILVNSKRAIIYSSLGTAALLIYYAIWGGGVIGLSAAFDLEMVNPLRLMIETIWWLACVELAWATVRGKANKPVVISQKQLRLVILLLLAIGSLTIGSTAWYRMKYLAVAQRRADRPVGKLLASHTVSQSFYSPADGLYQIDLLFGTYGRSVTSDVILHLTASPDARDDLATVQVNSREIENNAYHSFRFPRQRGIAGCTLYFYLEAPDASTGTAITPYRSNEDVYQHGQAYYNGVAASNDLAFVAHYQLGPLDAVRYVLLQLSEQRPCLLGHPLFYATLIVVHYALVSKLFVFLQERKARTSTGEETHS